MARRVPQLALIGLLTALDTAGADEPAPQPAGDSAAESKESCGRRKKDFERNCQRWLELSPEKREKMRRLFQHIEKLPPAEKEQFLERLRAMSPAARREALQRAAKELSESPRAEGDGPSRHGRMLRGMVERLPPEERERFERLSAPEKRQYLHRLMEKRWKEKLERLPAGERERLERMTPREQRDYFRDRCGRRVFEETFKDPEELRRLREMDPGKVAEALKVDAGERPASPPDILSKETWERWLKLERRDRERVLDQLRRTGGSQGKKNSAPPAAGRQPPAR